MLSCFLDCLSGAFVITLIIYGIKDAEDIDPSIGSILNEAIDQIIRVVSIGNQVLPSEKHLKRGIRHELL